MMGETIDNRQAVDRVVRERAGWVFAAARRRVGDAALAEDVAQAVFLLYWRRRPGGERPGKVAGWLHRAVRYCSANALRLKQIQQRHEREAAMQKKERIEGTGADWTEVEAELEGAMDRLSERDREVVLLRFYEQRPLAEVGRAMGISEEAARKRVDRALEKLRGILEKKGVRGTTVGLSAVLVGNVVGQMPKGLVGRIVSAVGSGGGNTVAAAIAKGAMEMMTMAKVTVAVLVLATATAVAVAVGAVALGERTQVAASSGAAGMAATASPAQQSVPTSAPSGPKAAFMEIAASARRFDVKGIADGFEAQTADEREFVASYAEVLVAMEQFRQAMESRFGSDERYSLMGAGNSIAMLPLEQATEHITGETASLEVANRTGGSIAVPMKLIGGRWRLPVNQMWDVIQKAADANGARIPPMKTISEASRKTAPTYQHVAELVKSGTYASKDDALKALERGMTKTHQD